MSELSPITRQFTDLTEMQEAFAHNYVANGGNGKRAAIAAGYAKGSAHVEASKMLRKAPIARAIIELATTSMATHVPGAIGTIGRLSKSAKSEYVQLEASKDVLTRLGLQAPTKVHLAGSVSINIDLS